MVLGKISLLMLIYTYDNLKTLRLWFLSFFFLYGIAESLMLVELNDIENAKHALW